MRQYDDLRLNGFSYDVRVLNAALEVMVHRKALAEAVGPAPSGMLGHLLLERLELLLEARAAGVHVPMWRRFTTGDSACTCGVVILAGLTAATSGGHLDLVLLTPVQQLVCGHRGDQGPDRLEAVCRSCAWARPADSVEAARQVLVSHACAGS